MLVKSDGNIRSESNCTRRFRWRPRKAVRRRGKHRRSGELLWRQLSVAGGRKEEEVDPRMAGRRPGIERLVVVLAITAKRHGTKDRGSRWGFFLEPPNRARAVD